MRKLRVAEKLQNQPFVSVTLVAVNIVVFIVCSGTGDLLYRAGRLSVYDVITRGEYGRILWAMFLHSDISHIFNNMVILFFLGTMLEKEMGHARYGVLYFLSGVGGNILSLAVKAVTHARTGSIGASGAVFGLDGALLAMVLFSGRKMENVTPARVLLMIALSLYSGFSGRNIDNAAHIGGLLTGFAGTLIMCLLRRSGMRRNKDNFGNGEVQN